MAHDVFISYSSKDKTTADAICAVLERDGIRCWIAPRDVTPGHDWAECIIQAIHGSKAFVLLFSGFSNASGQIKREVERAADREVPIIPFRLDDIAPNESLEFFISTPHWMDAFTPPLEGHIQRLSATLSQLLATSKAPGDPAAIEPPAPPRPIAPSPPQAAPARAGRTGVGAIAPWLIVAVLAAVIVIGGAVLVTRHGSASTAGPAATAASPSAAPATLSSAAAAAAPASVSAPQDQQTIAAAAPPAAVTADPTSAVAAKSCIVADPTPTPLNVRSDPNGKIVLTMENGATVHVLKEQNLDGKAWSLIGSGQDGPMLGWVFSDYLTCS